MSKKPPKKSDLKKGWMQRRQDLMRKIEPEYHLIVTEGTDTEPLYFQAVKEVIDKKYRERIHLDISGKGDNTLSLFRRAEKDVLLQFSFLNCNRALRNKIALRAMAQRLRSCF